MENLTERWLTDAKEYLKAKYLLDPDDIDFVDSDAIEAINTNETPYEFIDWKAGKYVDEIEDWIMGIPSGYERFFKTHTKEENYFKRP